MKSKDTLVSIIMPVFNGGEYLKLAIESILNQTYKNIEFLIMNDGSTDNTEEIVKEFNDERIVYFSNKKNIGLTRSLNKLILNSSGTYIARQDADDFSEKIRIENQVDYMSKSKNKICTTRAKIIDSNKKIPGVSFYLPHKIAIKYKNPFIHGSLLIEKKFLESIGGYDERFKYAQDYKLFKDILEKNIKIKSLNKTLYKLNNNNNISSKFFEEQKYYFNCARHNINP